LEFTQPLHTELNHDAFAADFVSVPGTELQTCLAGVMVDAYGYGNLALAINDPSLDPFGEGAGGVYSESAEVAAEVEVMAEGASGGTWRKGATRKVNVHLVEVWP
jgi:hypothetical protein